MDKDQLAATLSNMQHESDNRFRRTLKTTGKVFLGFLLVAGGVTVCIVSGGVAIPAIAVGSAALHAIAITALSTGMVTTVGGCIIMGMNAHELHKILHESTLNCRDVINLVLQDSLKEYEGFQLEFSQNDLNFVQFCLDERNINAAIDRIYLTLSRAKQDYEIMHRISPSQQVSIVQLNHQNNNHPQIALSLLNQQQEHKVDDNSRLPSAPGST